MADHRKNNLDLLRLFLAVAVFVGHGTWLLPQLFAEAWTLPFWLVSDLAVPCFFAISGYLIFASWERKPNLSQYTERRLLRIYPAFFVAIMVAAFGGFAMTSLSGSEYFSSHWIRYVCANLTAMNFIEKTLPGAFQSPATNVVNGSLWTIKIELMFYASVPVLSWLFHRWSRFAIVPMLAIYVASLIWFHNFHWAHAQYGASIYQILATQLPGQLCYFIAGYMIFRYQALFERHALLCVALAGLGVVIDSQIGLLLLKPMSIAVFTLYFAICIPQLIDLSKMGDISYGIYVFHFPLLHVAAYFVMNGWSPHVAFAWTTAIVFVVSFLSWRLIERPAMVHGGKLIQALAEKWSTRRESISGLELKLPFAFRRSTTSG